MMITAELNEYAPATFLAHRNNARDASPAAGLLILNQPVADFRTFARLWKNARYHICADGGANRLFDVFAGDLVEQREQYLPDMIHGDLDSLRDDVRNYYKTHSVEISQDSDQYSTDFGKSLNKLSALVPSSCLQDVLVLGSVGGRVDQGLGLLHEMIREQRKRPNLQLWLFSESSVSFILGSKNSIIRDLQGSREFTENVGLVPIFGAACITTSGLEWDVNEWATEMGGQVSTSNHVKADEIRVETTAPILFTIERRLVGEAGGLEERK